MAEFTFVPPMITETALTVLAFKFQRFVAPPSKILLVEGRSATFDCNEEVALFQRNEATLLPI